MVGFHQGSICGCSISGYSHHGATTYCTTPVTARPSEQTMSSAWYDFMKTSYLLDLGVGLPPHTNLHALTIASLTSSRLGTINFVFSRLSTSQAIWTTIRPRRTTAPMTWTSIQPK